MTKLQLKARALAGGAVLMLLGGCSTFEVMNAVQPKGGVAVTRDIVYGSAARRMLDVYAPRGAPAGRPVVVFFYGGNWDSGSKGDYGWVGAALARRGYVAIVPDYRLYPQARWPMFLEDGAQAVRWARDHATAFGGDPSSLVLMGHSAGAYNAVSLAVDRRWLSGVGMDARSELKAVIGLSGPYDFLPLHSESLKVIFGPEAQRPDTQPINHVDGRATPMLLITGDRDTVVDPGNSDRLAAKVRREGGAATVVHYPNLDHARTVAALSGPLGWLAPVMNDMAAFIGLQTAGKR